MNNSANVVLDLSILSRPKRTGIERYALNLARELQDNRFFQCKLLGNFQKDLFNKETDRISIDLPLSNPPEAQKLLSLSLFLEEASLIFSPYYPTPEYRPCKGIFTIHDLIPLRYPEWFPNQATHIFFENNIRNGIEHADHIIADSHSTKNDIVHFYATDPNKVSVVHLAADPHFFKGVKQKNILISRQKITSPYILSVCTFEPRKNLIRVLEAYSIFRKKNPSLSPQLVLVGSLGWGFDEIIQAINKNPYKDDIIATGFVSEKDLVNLYASAQLFIYASLYEGFGLPVLEAMASGTPVITAQNSSLGEVGQDSVLYADPYSPQDIANKIEFISTDAEIQQTLSDRGRSRAQDFSWQKTALETASTFARCLSN